MHAISSISELTGKPESTDVIAALDAANTVLFSTYLAVNKLSSISPYQYLPTKKFHSRG